MTFPRPYLRLIRSGPRRNSDEPAHFEQVQGQLVPVTDRVLCVVTADALDEPILRHVVTTLHPGLILDFRTAPRFDFGILNRLKAFRLFESAGAEYRDFANLVGSSISSMKAEQISLLIAQTAPTKQLNSLLVLVDSGLDYQSVGLTAAQRLRDRSADSWELLLFGPIEEPGEKRDIIFISHANPEDNEFVLWLQSQLTRLGYETWSDLSQLRAGEVFWDSIEEVIRRRAIRVIAVTSRVAMQKAGVLDEISLAIGVERSARLSGFVIPVRIDDVPFGDFRANLARKNILDFSAGWAVGLARLTDSLVHDNVPRLRTVQGQSLSSWWTQQKPPVRSVKGAEEVLSSNRYPLRSVPSRVYAYTGIPVKAATVDHGLIPFRNSWLSFRSPTELSRIGVTGITEQTVVSTNALFAGDVLLTASLRPGERQRLFHRMLNKQWEQFLLARGLHLYDQSGSQPTPYIPDGLAPNNTAHFTNDKGTQSRRLLVGFSVKKSLYWHLAPFAFFSTPSDTELNLKMRIVFSEDGQAKWPSTDRIRTMRRSFCKNWWNDRWRALQFSLMSWLSEGTDQVIIHRGESGLLSIDSAPITYLSPYSILDTQVESELKDDDSPRISEADDLLEDDDDFLQEADEVLPFADDVTSQFAPTQ